MARPFFVLLSLSLLFSACTQRMICPAYQSAFIYDKNELRKRFSYFQEDSTPQNPHGQQNQIFDCGANFLSEKAQDDANGSNEACKSRRA